MSEIRSSDNCLRLCLHLNVEKKNQGEVLKIYITNAKIHNELAYKRK